MKICLHLCAVFKRQIFFPLCNLLLIDLRIKAYICVQEWNTVVITANESYFPTKLLLSLTLDTRSTQRTSPTLRKALDSPTVLPKV